MIKTILIADCSPTIRKMVELTFSKSKIRVEAAGTGQEALDKIASTDPDLILAAVNLVNPAGFELCRQIKSSERPVPVLMLNSSFDSFDSARASECGANGHLPTPFETDELLIQVEALLENPHALTDAEPPPVATEDSEQVPTHPLSPEQFDALTQAVAQRLTEHALRDMAHDIVPELATKLIRERLRELESEDS